MHQIVPDIEQHCTEQFCILDPKVVTNPLTELVILYTNTDQLVNKMDNLSRCAASTVKTLLKNLLTSWHLSWSESTVELLSCFS